MKSLASKIALFGIAVILAGGLTEALLRVLKLPAVGVSHQPCIYVRDETNGYAYRPGSRDRMHRNFEMDVMVSINSNGFHDVERGERKNSDGLRMAAIGDSFTASLHVPVPAMWTQVLAREMTARGKVPVDVYNLGMDGTGTDVQVNILKTQLDRGLEFDRVILAFYKNDVDDVAIGPLFREVEGGYVITYQDESQKMAILDRLKNGQPSRRVAAAYRRSYLFRLICNTIRPGNLLRSNFAGPQQAGLQPNRKHEPGARLDAAFRNLISLSVKNHFELSVIPVPAKRDPDGSMKALTGNVSAEVLRQISVIDVVPALERLRNERHIGYREMFWKHDGHLNETGNRLFALAVVQAIDGARR